MYKFTGTLLALFTVSLLSFPLYAQELTYKEVQVKAVKKKVVHPNKNTQAVNFSIMHLEAPMPGGKGYHAKVMEAKQHLAKKYPRNSQTFKRQNSASEPKPEVMKTIVPEVGFTTKYPIGGGTPNDNTLAISNDGYLITAWNSEIYAYDMIADSAMYSPGQYRPTLTFNQFSPYPLSAPFDPKLLYDPDANKFILVFLSGRDSDDSKIIIGFSTASDPTAPWNVYELEGAPVSDSTWTDYPAIAMTDNELFLTVNLVIENEPWETGFEQTLVWQMNKQAGYNGDSILPSKMWKDIKYGNRFLRYLCPVQHGEGPQGNTMYFISNRNYPTLDDTITFRNDSAFLATLSGEMNNNPTLNVKHIASPIPYFTPPDALQPDNHTLYNNDGRVLGGIVLEDKIQFVASTLDTVSGKPVVYHGTFENINQPNTTLKANLITHPYLDLGYPNIAFAGDTGQKQDVLIGFDHAADTVFPGYSVVYYNGNTDSYSPVKQVYRGEDKVHMMSSGTGDPAYERWGDYFGIQRKYDEPGKLYTSGYWGVFPDEYASIAIAEINTVNFDTSGNDSTITGLHTDQKYKQAGFTVYPNPVSSENPYVQFAFSLARTENLVVTVTDISGKETTTLLDDRVKAGKNRIEFSTASFPPGVYILSINGQNGTSLSEKFVVE